MFIEVKNWDDASRDRNRVVEYVQKLSMKTLYRTLDTEPTFNVETEFLIWINDSTLIYKTPDETKANKIFTYLTGLLTGIQNCVVKVSVYKGEYSITDPVNMERCS